jgi:predicted DNA-binding transcriptional regulator AlpA
MTPATPDGTFATRGEAADYPVSLSRWVNERPPAWSEILSAHDVARLTRRRRWVISTLTFLGRFPKQQRFHDRPIGWAKHDVLTWIADSAVSHRRFGGLGHPPALFRRSLPMHVPRTRRNRVPCSAGRKRGGL